MFRLIPQGEGEGQSRGAALLLLLLLLLLLVVVVVVRTSPCVSCVHSVGPSVSRSRGFVGVNARRGQQSKRPLARSGQLGEREEPVTRRSRGEGGREREGEGEREIYR